MRVAAGERHEGVVVERHDREPLVPCALRVQRGDAARHHRRHPGDAQRAHRRGAVAAAPERVVGDDHVAAQVALGGGRVDVVEQQPPQHGRVAVAAAAHAGNVRGGEVVGGHASVQPHHVAAPRPGDGGAVRPAPSVGRGRRAQTAGAGGVPRRPPRHQMDARARVAQAADAVAVAGGRDHFAGTQSVEAEPEAEAAAGRLHRDAGRCEARRDAGPGESLGDPCGGGHDGGGHGSGVPERGGERGDLLERAAGAGAHQDAVDPRRREVGDGHDVAGVAAAGDRRHHLAQIEVDPRRVVVALGPGRREQRRRRHRFGGDVREHRALGQAQRRDARADEGQRRPDGAPRVRTGAQAPQQRERRVAGGDAGAQPAVQADQERGGHPQHQPSGVHRRGHGGGLAGEGEHAVRAERGGVRVVAEDEHAGPQVPRLGERVVLDAAALEQRGAEAGREGAALGAQGGRLGALRAVVALRCPRVVVHQHDRDGRPDGAEVRERRRQRGGRPVVGDHQVHRPVDFGAGGRAEQPLDGGHRGSSKQ